MANAAAARGMACDLCNATNIYPTSSISTLRRGRGSLLRLFEYSTLIRKLAATRHGQAGQEPRHRCHAMQHSFRLAPRCLPSLYPVCETAWPITNSTTANLSEARALPSSPLPYVFLTSIGIDQKNTLNSSYLDRAGSRLGSLVYHR